MATKEINTPIVETKTKNGKVTPISTANGGGNGDYTADILWMDNVGDIGAWFMNGTTILSTTVYGNVGKAWTVQALSSE